MPLDISVLRQGSRSLVMVSAGLLWLAAQPALAFECDNQDIEDPSAYYCGNDRGNYVLHPNGAALWVSAVQDEVPQLMVRVPSRTGDLMEQMVLQFNDLLSDSGGEYLVLGIGSNPHGNARGDAVAQVSGARNLGAGVMASALDPSNSPYYYNRLTRYGDTTGLVVIPAGEAPQLVAASQMPLGTDTDVCGAGIQPWPQIADTGHYVFAAELRDANGACSTRNEGGTDTDDAWQWCEDQAKAAAQAEGLASLDRLVIGNAPNPGNTYSGTRDVSVYYTVYPGKTINPGDSIGVRLFYGSVAVNLTKADLCSGSQNFMNFIRTDWDQSVEGVLTVQVNNSNINEFICPLGTECDVDVSAMDLSLWSIDPASVPNNDTYKDQGPRPSGVRAIARGQAGSTAPQTVVRAVRYPRSDAEEQMSVMADVASGVGDADHPLASGGQLQYWIREADAITHSGDMLGADGGFVTPVGLQAAPSKLVFDDRQDNWGNNLDGEGWPMGLLYTDAAGTVSLVAARDSSYISLYGAQTTSSPGVLYRAGGIQSGYCRYFDNTSEVCLFDHDLETKGRWGYAGLLSYSGTAVYDVVGFSGTTSGDLPASATPGEWHPTVVLYNTDTSAEIDSFVCAINGTVHCSVVVTSATPGASDVTLSLHVRPNRASKHTALKAAADAGHLGAKVTTNNLYDAMQMEQVADAAHTINFTLSSDHLVLLGGDGTNFRFTNPSLAVKHWDKASGTTTTVWQNAQVAPDGFSLLKGVPKHFDEGGGVIAGKVGLETPYLGSLSGDAGDNPYDAYDAADISTILGRRDPCRDALPAEFSDIDEIDGGSRCQAILVSESGVLKEVARTAGAELTLREGVVNSSEVGVTGVDGFTFVEFGAAVAVTETGTVFFNAQTRDAVEAFSDESTCAIGDILDQYGDNRHGVFAYRGGTVEKVVAEGDVITVNGSEAFVKAIALPQPELRQAAAGDAIMLKMAVDTDGDCVEDTVGLVKATTPGSASLGDAENPLDYNPDMGMFLVVKNENGGNVRIENLLVNLETGEPEDNGWRLNDFRPVSASEKEYLTDEQVAGGFYSFRATWCKNAAGNPLNNPPAACDLLAVPDLQIALVLDDVPVADFADAVKDIASTPSLLDNGTISETESGGTKIVMRFQDDSEFDLDGDSHEYYDPFGLEMVVRAIGPAVPVPLLGHGLWIILAGMVSMLGGVFGWRRTAR